MKPDVYNSLGFFPKVLANQSNNLHEVEKIPFVNYFFEWTFDQFKDSAIFYLDILKESNKSGYILSDATPLNITYEGIGKFTFIDHGSLIKKEGEQWTAFYQFLKEYVYPLIYLSDDKLRLPLSLLPIISSKDWYFSYKPDWSRGINPKYLLVKSALNLSAKKSLSDTAKKTTSSISNQYKYNLEFFTEYVKGLKQPKLKTTRWGNYYSETVLADGYVERKQQALLQFFGQISDRVKIGLDLGTSDGEMPFQLTSRHKDLKFIGVESDPIASIELYKRSKKTNIIPIYNSIYWLTPPAGVGGSTPGLVDRLQGKVDLVMGLGLIHHMMNEENLSHENILKYFTKLIGKGGYMILEYIEPNDPRYRLIENTNYPFTKDIESWELAILAVGKIITKQTLTENRHLYLIIKN